MPPDLANLVALAGAWAAFGAAEAIQSESGIMAVVMMGLTLQRGAVPEERRLRRFKEQLTVLGISLLFVLLAANLPLDVLRAEGWRGLLTVLALMLVVRPVSVAIALRGSSCHGASGWFVAWIGPRGIVAASVASLSPLCSARRILRGSAAACDHVLTVALTVTLAGSYRCTDARLARAAELGRHKVISLAREALGRAIAEVFRRNGRPVVIVDRNPALVDEASALGFAASRKRSGRGDARARSALRAETLVAATTNSEVNALAAHLAHDAFGVTRAYPVLGHPSRGQASGSWTAWEARLRLVTQ